MSISILNTFFLFSAEIFPIKQPTYTPPQITPVVIGMQQILNDFESTYYTFIYIYSTDLSKGLEIYQNSKIYSFAFSSQYQMCRPLAVLAFFYFSTYFAAKGESMASIWDDLGHQELDMLLEYVISFQALYQTKHQLHMK